MSELYADELAILAGNTIDVVGDAFLGMVAGVGVGVTVGFSVGLVPGAIVGGVICGIIAGQTPNFRAILLYSRDIVAS